MTQLPILLDHFFFQGPVAKCSHRPPNSELMAVLPTNLGLSDIHLVEDHLGHLKRGQSKPLFQEQSRIDKVFILNPTDFLHT